MWYVARALLYLSLAVDLAGVSAEFDTPLKILEYTDNIRRPLHDTRSYRYLLLSNGMKVLLVSDPEGDEAAASVAVGVGSFADPPDLQGLAHFTEHMLFQGSKKFATNTGFFDFIHEKGGKANAYTSQVFTVLSFAVPARHLTEALERVADIFASPTLDPRDAMQEVKAVHEEYAIRLSDDAVRLSHLARQSRLQLPFSNFSVGSLDSLIKEPRMKRLDVAVEMKKFHSKWYASENMTLAIVGKEPLDQMGKMVTRLFRFLPRRSPSSSKAKFGDVMEVELFFRESESFKQHLITGCSLSSKPFAPDEMQTVTYFKPLAPVQRVHFFFPVPPQRFSWDSKPLEYIQKLINYQGPGSLSQRLKSLGLVSGVSASQEGQDYCTLLRVTFVLMDTDTSDETVEALGRVLFLYLRAVRLWGLNNWRFKEITDVDRVLFEARDVPPPYELSQEAAEALHFLPPAELLAGSFLVYVPDLFLVKSLLDYYLVPTNVRVFVEDKLLSVSYLPRREKRYQIPYWSTSISGETREQWRRLASADKTTTEEAMAAEGLSLPSTNPFVALIVKDASHARAEREAEASGEEDGRGQPVRLGTSVRHFCLEKKEFQQGASEEVCQVFHKRDNVFRVPKVSVTLTFYYPPPRSDGEESLNQQSALDRDAVMNELFVHLANLSLAEVFSQAFEAGAVVLLTSGMPAPSVPHRRNGLTLHVVGLSSLVPSLLLSAARALGCGRRAGLHLPMDMKEEEGIPFSPDEADASVVVKDVCFGLQNSRSFLIKELLPAALHRVLTAAAAAVRTRSPGLQALDRMQEILVAQAVPPHRFLKAVRSLVDFYKKRVWRGTTAQSEAGETEETVPKRKEDAWRGDLTRGTSLLLSEKNAAMPPLQDAEKEDMQTPRDSDEGWRTASSDWWIESRKSSFGRSSSSAGETEGSGRHWLSGEGERDSRSASKDSSQLEEATNKTDLPDPLDMLTSVTVEGEHSQSSTAEGRKSWRDLLFEDIVAWSREAMRRVFVEGLIEGDVDYGTADSLLSQTLRLLSPEVLLSEQAARAHLSVLPLDSARSRLVEVQVSVAAPTWIDLALQQSPHAPFRRLRRRRQRIASAQSRLSVLATNAAVTALWQGRDAKETDFADQEATQRKGETSVFSLAVPNTNRSDPKNHVAVLVEAGELTTVREKALAFMASYDLSQRFFNALRTKQQLGYSVHLSPLRLEKRVFFLFSITTLYDPEAVEERVAAFVAAQRRRILGLQRGAAEAEGGEDGEVSPTQEERSRAFEDLRKAAAAVWEKAPKNLAEDVERNLGQIVGREYIFDLNKEMVKEIGLIEMQEFEHFIKTRFFDAPRLTIKVFSVAKVPKEIKAFNDKKPSANSTGLLSSEAAA